MVILVLAGLGLAFGSFINALVWRLHVQSSVVSRQSQAKKTKDWSILTGRSMCVHCRHQLAGSDLIPVVSWLMLKGRCRYCHKPIHWQYPVVELATAVLFVLSYAAWPSELSGGGHMAYFGLWLVAVVLMMALLIYDLRWMILPDKLNWPFVLTGLVSIAILAAGDAALVRSRLLGLAAAWGFFALLFYGSKGRWLGGGDVRFSIGMGAWLGLSKTLVGMLVAFYSASLVIIPLLLTKVVGRKQPVPFGPFLIIGTITAMLYGQQLIDWYSRTFLYGGL